ncbi:MAG: Xaa-Pro peptidase family protein [Thermoanaerobacterales bacterium]|nr:Xaa-Pro peptidase family protein [Bacillota bacterium]MDI6906754.1 Xaa-Pro peptidase family protein [Thermoanaerobacterales bacterium]
MNGRLAAVREKMDEAGHAALLVTGEHNRRYLAGFTGTTGVLLITAAQAYFLTDFRYLEQARAESPDFELVRVERTWVESLAQLAADLGLSELAFESDHLTYYQHASLQEKLPGVSLSPTRGLVEQMRAAKDEDEIAAIRRAVGIVDEVFADVVREFAAGPSERELAAELEYRFRKAGADGSSFATIVASGARSALPHGVASEKPPAPGDLVIIDCGCVHRGYCSDFTRTLHLGPRPADWQEEIYRIVLEAQQAAIAAIRPGVPCREVDAAAREVITRYGYGDYFGHSTGHGLGLEIHEEPRLSALEERLLAEGNVVTVEPGIYLPGKGGVRIEDVVVVREDAAEILTRTPKNGLILV